MGGGAVLGGNEETEPIPQPGGEAEGCARRSGGRRLLWVLAKEKGRRAAAAGAPGVDVAAVRGAGGRHVPILQEQSPHATPSVMSAAQASVLLLLRGLLVRLLVRFGLFGGALLRGGGQEG